MCVLIMLACLSLWFAVRIQTAGGGGSLWTSTFPSAWLSLQIPHEKSIPADCGRDDDKGPDLGLWVGGGGYCVTVLSQKPERKDKDLV